jgi:hypothetical protein
MKHITDRGGISLGNDEHPIAWRCAPRPTSAAPPVHVNRRRVNALLFIRSIPSGAALPSVLAQLRGQEATVVVADLARDQPIQKFVLAHDELAVGAGVDGEIDHLVWIAFEVE